MPPRLGFFLSPAAAFGFSGGFAVLPAAMSDCMRAMSENREPNHLMAPEERLTCVLMRLLVHREGGRLHLADGFDEVQIAQLR